MTIRVHCMTVVIKKSAVEHRYPGGLAAFVGSYRPGAEDADLVGMGFMASGEVYQFLDVLAAIGFDPARDFALGDMFIGEMLGCEGIRFECEGDSPLDGWRACQSEAETGDRDA